MKDRKKRKKDNGIIPHSWATHIQITSEQWDFVEGTLQLSHENVDEAIFGQMPRLFGVLVINHHFLLPAHLHLHTEQTTRKRGGWIFYCATIESMKKEGFMLLVSEIIWNNFWTFFMWNAAEFTPATISPKCCIRISRINYMMSVKS